MIPDLKQRALASQNADMPKDTRTKDYSSDATPVQHCQEDINVYNHDSQLQSESNQHLHINDNTSQLVFIKKGRSPLHKYLDRRPKRLVPDSRKDDHYWQKRKKNNDAARKSRNLKRKKDIDIRQSLAEFQNHNAMLQEELLVLKKAFNLSNEKRYIGVDKNGHLVCTSVMRPSTKTADIIQDEELPSHLYTSASSAEQEADEHQIQPHDSYHWNQAGVIKRTDSFQKSHCGMNIPKHKDNHQFFAEDRDWLNNSSNSGGEITTCSDTSCISSPTLFVQRADSTDRCAFLVHPQYGQHIDIEKNMHSTRLGHHRNDTAVGDQYYNNPYWQSRTHESYQRENTLTFPTDRPAVANPQKIAYGSRPLKDTKYSATSERVACGDCSGIALHKSNHGESGCHCTHCTQKMRNFSKSSINLNNLHNITLVGKHFMGNYHQLKSSQKPKVLNVVG